MLTNSSNREHDQPALRGPESLQMLCYARHLLSDSADVRIHSKSRVKPTSGSDLMSTIRSPSLTTKNFRLDSWVHEILLSLLAISILSLAQTAPKNEIFRRDELGEYNRDIEKGEISTRRGPKSVGGQEPGPRGSRQEPQGAA